MLKLKHPLLLILLMALVLRLWGVNHGLPHIYSVDEPALVRSVMGLRFDLNPHHFDWPHFHFYFCYLFFVLLVKFRALIQVLNLRPTLEPLVPTFWQDPQIFYLQMRIISAVMGAATVGLVYLIGKKLFDKKVGLLGAALLTVYPFHNEMSHFALLEAPLTFWITLSFFFSVLIFRNGRRRDYLLAGLFAGLAASTKYNGALVVVPIITTHFLRVVNARRRKTLRVSSSTLRVGEFGGLLLAGLAAVGGFLVGTPFALLDWKHFLSHEPGRGFLWQMKRVGAVSWQELPQVLWERLGILVSGSGVVIAVLGVWGLFVVLRNKRRKGLLFLSFPLVYFFYISRLGYFNAHYFMPLAPFISLLAAYGLWTLFEKKVPLCFFACPVATRSVCFGVLLFLCFLLQPLFLSARSSFIFSQPDTRQIAGDWMEETIPQGSRIAQRGEYQPVLSGFELVGTHDLSPDWLEENEIDHVLITSYDLMEQDRPGLNLVKKIEPYLQPGPTVLIYEVAQ